MRVRLNPCFVSAALSHGRVLFKTDGDVQIVFVTTEVFIHLKVSSERSIGPVGFTRGSEAGRGSWHEWLVLLGRRADGPVD